MIRNAYTLYDRKALVYHPPFYALADGEACRILADIVSDASTMVGRHPGDYVLYRCGGYDDASGSLLPISVLEHIADASQFVVHRGNLPLFRDVSEPSTALDGHGSPVTE